MDDIMYIYHFSRDIFYFSLGKTRYEENVKFIFNKMLKK